MSRFLFNLDDSQIRMSHAQHRAAKVREWKTAHDIYSHHAGHMDPPWMAMSMSECREALEGYELEEAEKTDGVKMLAGYCNLLDDAGLISYGQTQFEACERVAKRLEGNR